MVVSAESWRSARGHMGEVRFENLNPEALHDVLVRIGKLYELQKLYYAFPIANFVGVHAMAATSVITLKW